MISASSADIPEKLKAIEELLAKGIGSVPGPTVLSQPTSTSAPAKLAKSMMKIEAKNFTFELQECKLSGGILTFLFLITNNENDRGLQISDARIIDDSGNETDASWYQLGNYSYGYWARNTLASGIPMKAIITFENIPDNINLIALLELYGDSSGSFKLQFRNIPITK